MDTTRRSATIGNKTIRDINRRVDKLVKFFLFSVLCIATTLFIMAFLGCNKEEIPEKEPDTAILFKGKIVEADKSETSSVTITGERDFGRNIEGITVHVNGNEVEVLRVADKEITVAIPIRYEGELKFEVWQDGKLAFQTVVESIKLVRVSTLAGSVYGFANGPGASAKFADPTGVAVDAAGNIYVADRENHKIRKVTPDGYVTTLAGSTEGFADNIVGSNAKFDGPTGVAVDGQGNVYVADDINNRIRMVKPDGRVQSVAGSTQGFADGPVGSAQFNRPYAVAVDAGGIVYVADAGNFKIRKIVNGVVSTLAGSTQGFADGIGNNAQFDYPQGIAVDVQGNVLVADPFNGKIRKITPGGVVSTLALYGVNSNTDLPKSPSGIAIDAFNNIYLTDFPQIKKINPNGGVSILAGGTMPSGCEDGIGTMAKFNVPRGVVVGSSGILYVADADFCSKIRKITL